MKQFQDFAKCVVFVLLAIMLIVLSQAISDIDAAFNELRPKALATISDTDEAAQKGIAAFTSLESVASKQEVYWEGLPRITKKVVADFHDLVIHTDVQLNGTANNRLQGMIPQTTETLRILDGAITELDGAIGTLNSSATDADHAVLTFDEAGKNLVHLTGDPNISKSFAESTAALTEIDGMASDGHKATTLAYHQMQEYFKPVSMSMRIFKFLTGHLVDGTEMWWYLTQ